MPLSLREAMTMAEPLRRSRLVAGDRGLDNIVQSVNVMEVPNILDWVRPGELLVTTMYPLRDDPGAVKALVPKLAEKGLAGLAVTPSGYLEAFPQAMLDAANRLAFPLIELPPNVSFIDIIQPLTTEILSLQANELRESQRIHRHFIELVLGGGGYNEIAQGIAQHLGSSVTIVDRFRRLLGSGTLIGRPQPHRSFIHDDGTGDVYLDGHYQRLPAGPLPAGEARHISLDGPGGTVDVLVCPVKVGSMALGEILVWGPLPQSLRAMDLIAIEHGSTVAALKMMEMRSISQVEERFRNEILEGLLSEHSADRQRAIQLSQDLGSRLNPPFVVILIGPDLPAGAALSKAQSSEQSDVHSSLHLARRYLRALQPEASFWYQGPRQVVFFPVSADRRGGLRESLTQDLRRVCERVASDNPPYTVSAGVSGVANMLSKFQEAYQGARRSLDMGRLLQGQRSSVVTHYEDLGLFRVLSLAESPSGLERFCHATLGALIDYDRANGTELVMTLRVYLDSNQNGARAAKTLFIHYNTLRYRLDRIAEILGHGVDLENPQQRLTLEVALQLFPLFDQPHVA